MIMTDLLSLSLTCTVPNMTLPTLEIIEAGFTKSRSHFFFIKNSTDCSTSRAIRASEGRAHAK